MAKIEFRPEWNNGSLYGTQHLNHNELLRSQSPSMAMLQLLQEV